MIPEGVEKKVGAFDVLKVMCRRNMDVRLSTLENLLKVRKVKAGTNITIGFGDDVVGALAVGKFLGGLLLADRKQFEAVRKELEDDTGRL